MKFFSSDLHISHTKILTITLRGQTFSSIEEHDQTIIDNINNKVGRKDELFLLGDISFYIHPRKIRQKINCKNITVCAGNHDRKQQLRDAFGYSQVHDIRVTNFSNGEKVVLCHYAMYVWPSSHYGTYMLYGHSHMAIEEKLDNLFPQRRSMDVGVDNYFRLFGKYEPFSEEEIFSVLQGRGGHDGLEFYRDQEKKWKK